MPVQTPVCPEAAENGLGATIRHPPASSFYSLIGSCLRRKVNPREYLHWLFTKLPTVTAPNVGHFTPAAYAAVRPQGAPLTAVA